MRRSPLLAVLWLVLVSTTATGAGLPAELQEVPRLTWLTPGFLPDRGLMTIGLAGSRYHPGYNPTGGPAHYDVLQATAFLHWTPLSWLAVSGQQQWRSWSNYQVPGQTPSGSGLADGAFRLTVAVPWLPEWLGITAWGGGNLPVGQAGLGEEAFSSEAGGSLSVALWRRNQWPELRLHASCGRRRNGNEELGFGAGQGQHPQPWYPQYPAAASDGGDRSNDFTTYALALEFRQHAASLWVEWSTARLDQTDLVAPVEDQQILAAGLIWGLREGWALHADYQVGLWKDDLATDWYPRHPHIGFTFAASRQFAWRGPW